LTLALITLAFSLLGVLRAEQVTEESFTEAMTAARRDAESKAGRKYEQTLAHGLAEHLSTILTECLKGSRIEANGVEVVMKVAFDGTISTALAFPETDATRCAALKFVGATLAKPPKPDHWIAAGVAVREGVPSPERGPTGPGSDGRFFKLRSSEAWVRVQQKLSDLGLARQKIDQVNHVVLTGWRDVQAKGVHWLPALVLPQSYVATRLRFEVFVSPFAEPARLYVGSIVEVRRPGLKGVGAVYNNPIVNRALMSQLAGPLGEDGVPIPKDPRQRRQLALSLLGDDAAECLRREGEWNFRGATQPEIIPISRFEMLAPDAAPTTREVSVEVAFEVQEDGGVNDVHALAAPSEQQFGSSAMGPLSLLLYSPAMAEGCPVTTRTTLTVNYKR
jgi:hypothetical protein